MRYFLFIFLFCCSITVFSADKKVVVYDTSATHVIKKASIEKEKEIFADKEFIYKKDAKESKSWWDSFLEWLSRLLSKLFGKSIDKNPNLSYNILKYTFITAFIIGLIYILWKSKFIGLLKRDAKKLDGSSFTDLPENIEGLNIDALVEEAIQKQNYRLAVRWCFLKSLQWLNKQNKIAWQPAKTNVDYQQELKDKTLKAEFTSLSYVFEYVWYGETDCNEKLCTDYKTRVEKFIQTHV
ncbi:MAG TPA: DUF4129 domain-containing protein [Bacteroidia bacterium]|nr:DUF4129 domain-containing protein [Bacteroidia bacterium]